MLRYLKFSLGIHLLLFAVLIFSFYFSPQPKVERLRFVVLPKGTGLDHVLTKSVANKLTQPPSSSNKSDMAQSKPTPVTSSQPPVATPEIAITPVPASTPTPAPVKSTPSETPAVAHRATPQPTPESTPDPTPAPTPQQTPHNTLTPRPSPSATPKATATHTPKAQPTKTATPKPTAKASPTTAAGGKPVPKEKQAAKTVATPKRPPTPTPKQLASAYDLTKGESGGKDPRLPRQTPAGATAVDEAPAGKQAGVPGVQDGVEGAPLALNSNQSALPQLYTNRAILLLQRNFLVPEGVNDPDLTCIVEWEILPDGLVRNAKVVKSTGNADYDKRALDAVEKTANLGPLPPQFAGKTLWVSLPFIYGQ
jgi:TonB family protein